ncbi:MAG: permease, partial [Scardovia wiggsiae]|nr:permease [Scardovia wiggsiae]
HHKKVPEKATCAQMLTIYLEDSRDEFFSVGGYLLIGALIASALGASALTAVLKSWSHGSGTLLAGLVLLAVMMLAGFVMSVCSSSDAVIGRSFSTYIPFDSVLGFLVFGPMMDIKNVLMLQSRFNRRFIMRLVLSVAGTCFAAMAVRLVVVMI